MSSIPSLSLLAHVFERLTCAIGKRIPRVGKKVIYFEIDSLLPLADWVPPGLQAKFEKGPDSHFRVRTIRLRGELSQGMIISCNTPGFPEAILNGQCNVGDDVTALLGVKKYEPPDDDMSSHSSRLVLPSPPLCRCFDFISLAVHRHPQQRRQAAPFPDLFGEQNRRGSHPGGPVAA